MDFKYINLLTLIVLFSLYYNVYTTIPSGAFKNQRTIIFVILTQPSTYHEQLAQHLIDNIKEQILENKIEDRIIFHKINQHKDNAAWTFIPLFELLNDIYEDKFDWIVFCEERTRFDLPRFATILNQYEPSTNPIWFGHALYDLEASIIHHFEFYQDPTSFKYPNTGSGFVMSRSLFQYVLNQISMTTLKKDFSIDTSYELALLIWKLNNTIIFKHDTLFCAEKTENCATYPLKFDPCNDNVHNSILFAVKTCKQFHSNRIPIVKNTWGKYYNNVIYFSDENDVAIPTIKINVTNVQSGHCMKTKSILNYIQENINNYAVEWIAIVDDDTIMGVSRLHQFLSCFDSSKPKAIGQRYGFGLTSKDYKGYNYITGGGGIVISKPLLKLLVDNNSCTCETPETPDDMFIFGSCLSHLKVPIIHSPLFHQARPSDYAPAYLQSDPPISFHKHWMVNPVKIYQEWFEKHDSQWYNSNSKIHDDL